MYLLPRPKTIEQREGIFYPDYQTRIVIDPSVGANGTVYASILKDCMTEWTGLVPAIVRGVCAPNDICLVRDDALGSQEYRLTIAEDGITAAGGDEAAVLYAVQTLCQIIEQTGAALGCVQITDSPDLMHRGYSLDQTRGRVLKLDELKKVIDHLSRYKINEFQLYVEHTYLFRDLTEMWRDETPLTAEDILALDRYCAERNIELVPSLASFGHLYTLLSTKSYGDLCELEHSDQQPFSFWDRLSHHTINVADERALPLVKGMMEEYMALFTSNKFNLCADETFDLGKGRAKALADEKGVHNIYIAYVKELCEFLVAKGKQPMFWGDVICEQPELIGELPEETICLTWGYAPDQSDESTRGMAQAGAKQYLCPAVIGWNRWLNWIEDSYENITRMCRYAQQYRAVGILNTDWGDYGHVNLVEYSVPGMIYGAAFSWNQEQIPFEEINRQIACVEYHDASESLVNLLARVQKHTRFGWDEAVIYYDIHALRGKREPVPDLTKFADAAAIEADNAALAQVRCQLKENAVQVDSSRRWLFGAYDMTIHGIWIWNRIGVAMERLARADEAGIDAGLAAELERWFMFYKDQWRKSSREGDLGHLSEIVFWYADLLRGRRKLK